MDVALSYTTTRFTKGKPPASRPGQHVERIIVSLVLGKELLTFVFDSMPL
jgi:hypothetical protein